MGKIIAFANQKGGVSKTTSSSLMAYGLSRRGFKVLLVDLDPQRNLSKNMKAVTTGGVKTSMELLLGEATAEEAVQKLECFDIIPARKELSSIEPLMPLSGRLKKLKKTLAPIKDKFDYIILDTAPSLSVLFVNALVAADEVIIPSTASVFSIEGFLDLFQTIRDVQQEDDNPDLIVRGVLITMFNNRTIISKELADMTEALSNKFGVSTFNTKIRTSVFISESQVHQFDPFEKDPNNIACIDFNNFLDEFLKGGH